MTRFQLILPIQSQNVTKNRTDHRMHVEGPQIYQINRQTNSFQNMYDMLKAKIDRLPRKIDILKKCFFFCKNRFSWPNGQLLLTAYHTYYESYCSAVNLAYLGTLYVHPVTHPIFCNIVGINWHYELKPFHRLL